MASPLLQYIAIQLLVLAASLDEKLRETNEGVLPLNPSSKVTPSNLPELILEAKTRAASVAPSPSPSAQPVVAPSQPPAVSQPPIQVRSPPSAQPVVTPAPQVPPVAPPTPSVSPAAAAPAPPAKPLGRRKRSISDVLAAASDVVGDVASAVGDSPAFDASPIGVVADVVAPVAELVESHFTGETPQPPVDSAESQPGPLHSLVTGVVAPAV